MAENFRSQHGFFAFIVKINQTEKSRGAFTEKNKTISQTVRKL